MYKKNENSEQYSRHSALKHISLVKCESGEIRLFVIFMLGIVLPLGYIKSICHYPLSGPHKTVWLCLHFDALMLLTDATDNSNLFPAETKGRMSIDAFQHDFEIRSFNIPD